MTVTQNRPLGSRPAHSPTRLRGTAGSNLPSLPTSRSNSLMTNAPMLSAPSTNYSLLSFDRNRDNGHTAESPGSFDFLPSVSFDELHTSIESASTDFKLTQFPSPTGEGSILEGKGLMERKLPERPIMTQNTGTTRGSIPPPPSRPGRSGSILRRPSTSSRQTSVSSVVSSSSGGTLDAPSAPAAMRNRRQSQFPPVSNAAAPRPPRKSMGPGVIADSDLAARNAPARRTSLLGDKNAPGTLQDGLLTVVL
ncbi:serine/threonine protein kinase, CMGC, dual-specificity [Metarhizium acridum]|nr:serine/threonine protein kinase, CMGC, dual-specificity [Metarhizium acridum]